MQKHLSLAGRAGLVCLLLAISACVNFSAVDKSLENWTDEHQRLAGHQIEGDRSQELLVLLAFSGGGTRAAAFSYGVLKELAATKVMTEKGMRPLLDEIDVISSVSGGSFTSAYYGLRGDRIFEDFEDRFLRTNIEGALIWQILRPINWFRMLSSTYGRADLAAKYYDKQVFDGATFADFRRPGAPIVVINATDLASGMRFPFITSIFDAICADLDSYPVSRAVAASSAVPVLFTPVTIKSYAGSCGYEPPAWLEEAAKDESRSNLKLEAQNLEELLDRKKRPWFHLVDGGISDNLGLRAFYSAISLVGDPHAAFRALHHPDVRRILVILVDAHKKTKTDWALKRASPSLGQIVSSISADQISSYSLDTIDIVRASFTRWAEAVSTPQRPVTFTFVEVDFEGVRDPGERQLLYNIGTSFNLNDKEVDHLISAASEVLRGSEEFKAFIGDSPME
jgi:NTE family protein